MHKRIKLVKSLVKNVNYVQCQMEGSADETWVDLTCCPCVQAHAGDGDPAEEDGGAAATVHEGQGDLPGTAGQLSHGCQENAGD